jgi:heme exporter protein D
VSTVKAVWLAVRIVVLAMAIRVCRPFVHRIPWLERYFQRRMAAIERAAQVPDRP